MSLVNLHGEPLPRQEPAPVNPANPGDMPERVVPRLQGDFFAVEFHGHNVSGILPLGKNVLVCMDVYKNYRDMTGPDGKTVRVTLDGTGKMTDQMNMGSESGVVCAIGDQAFSRNNDLTTNTGLKPVIGDRVYCEKYAGREIMGDDGHKYRLMLDSCIAGLYRRTSPVIQEETAA